MRSLWAELFKTGRVSLVSTLRQRFGIASRKPD